jgi:hypothetical protein
VPISTEPIFDSLIITPNKRISLFMMPKIDLHARLGERKKDKSLE